MHLIAILLVMTAGIMWAGCGLAAQDFFQKSTHDSMDLTVFRMFCASGIMLLVTIAKGQLKDSWQKLGQQPSLWWGLIFYGVVGLMLMHYTYFASIAAGNAAAATVIQYTCPAMVILWVSFQKRRLPLAGELAAVVLAIIGVLLLVTGGDVSRLSVPADCVYLGLASAVFFAICCVFPKRFIGVLDNSFVLALGMFSGSPSRYFLDRRPWYGAIFYLLQCRSSVPSGLTGFRHCDYRTGDLCHCVLFHLSYPFQFCPGLWHPACSPCYCSAGHF